MSFTFKDAVDEFDKSLSKKTSLSPKQRRQAFLETRSAVINYLLPLWGHTVRKGKRLTQAEIKVAYGLMAQIEMNEFPALKREFEAARLSLDASQANRYTYGARLQKFFAWMQQNCWPRHHHQPAIACQCAPKKNHGFGNVNEFHLTGRRGERIAYRLTEAELEKAPVFRQQQAELFQFFTQIKHPERCGDDVSPESAQQSIDDLNLLAGFMHHHQGVPLAELCLERVIPTVQPEEMDALTSVQQKKRWRVMQKQLDRLLCNYYEFMRTEQQAISPRTWSGRLGSILAVTRFCYRDWVEAVQDYELIPVIRTLERHNAEAKREVAQWQQQGRFVSDFDLKIPNYAQGSTALDTVRNQIVEPLRLECAPRSASGRWRNFTAVACSLQVLLIWMFLTLFPARRQQEYRSMRVALSCPIQPPEEIPPGGVIFPLPPPELRDRNKRRDIADNYLYRTYHYEGRHYPDGVWVMEVTKYKTKKSYGVFSVPLENHTFRDGSCFYDYLEWFLTGRWIPFNRGQSLYDWWDPALKGQRGRWVTSGRLAFEPEQMLDLGVLEKTPWRAGFLFLKTRSGKKFQRHSDFSILVSHRAFRLIGKVMAPHTMRYVWASWAFQVGLSDAEVDALAYMMGHSANTLRTMYQKCTPSERQQVINRAIETHFRVPGKESHPLVPDVAELLTHFRRLSHQEQVKLFAQMGEIIQA
jgi:hypothetical protein